MKSHQEPFLARDKYIKSHTQKTGKQNRVSKKKEVLRLLWILKQSYLARDRYLRAELPHERCEYLPYLYWGTGGEEGVGRGVGGGGG